MSWQCRRDDSPPISTREAAAAWLLAGVMFLGLAMRPSHEPALVDPSTGGSAKTWPAHEMSFRDEVRSLFESCDLDALTAEPPSPPAQVRAAARSRSAEGDRTKEC